MRMELRTIEVDLQRLRHERRFYRRLGFGPDLQDMELQDLLGRKRDCEQRLRQIQQRVHRGASALNLLSWVAMAPLLIAMGLQSLVTRRERSIA
jgi:hypothetical protein